MSSRTSELITRPVSELTTGPNSRLTDATRRDRQDVWAPARTPGPTLYPITSCLFDHSIESILEHTFSDRRCLHKYAHTYTQPSTHKADRAADGRAERAKQGGSDRDMEQCY